MNSDGSVIAIGAIRNDGNGIDAGHIRVYEFNGTNYIQRGQDIDGEAARDQFGYSVAMNFDGSVIAVGAIENDGNGNNAGHVRVFECITLPSQRPTVSPTQLPTFLPTALPSLSPSSWISAKEKEEVA
mmetsp:Transcript_11783/g.13686  ORF Transcript_11783/g.13686 Transcript_11783/m.13686 type:complete len:128 (+) Transcript_11783:1-384(+)